MEEKEFWNTKDFTIKKASDCNLSEQLHYFLQYFSCNNTEYQGYCTLYKGVRIPNMDKIDKHGFPYCFKKELRDIGSWKPDVFTKEVSSMYFGKRHDYFITVNRTKKPHGTGKKNTFGLNALVIDINGHGIFHPSDPDGESWAIHTLNCLVYDLLCSTCLRVPLPNAIVFTGRGLQLWWKINPASYKMKKVYAHVAEKYAQAVQRFVSASPYAQYFTVKTKVSEDRLARLPGTYNIESETYGDFFMVSNECIDLAHEIDEWRKAQRWRYVLTYAPTSGMPAKREESLRKLLKLRGDVSWEKELYILYVYNAYRTITGDDERAMRRVESFNCQFEHPLTRELIDRYLQSSKELGGYKFSNKEIIDKLKISEQEQKKIGLKVIPDTSPNEDEEARDRKRKKRNKEILRLCKETTMSQTEIAAELQVSKSTVSRILKKNHIKTKKQKAKDNVVRLLKKGSPVKTVFHQYKDIFSLSELYYLAEKVREMRRGKCVYVKGFFRNVSTRPAISREESRSESGTQRKLTLSKRQMVESAPENCTQMTSDFGLYSKADTSGAEPDDSWDDDWSWGWTVPRLA